MLNLNQRVNLDIVQIRLRLALQFVAFTLAECEARGSAAIARSSGAGCIEILEVSPHVEPDIDVNTDSCQDDGKAPSMAQRIAQVRSIL